MRINLINLRKKRGFKQKEIAKKLGIIEIWYKLKNILNSETIDYLLEQEVDRTNLTSKE